MPAPCTTGSALAPAPVAPRHVVLVRLDGRDPGDVDATLAVGAPASLLEPDGVTPARIFPQPEPPVVGCHELAGLVVHGLGCALTVPALPPVWS